MSEKELCEQIDLLINTQIKYVCDRMYHMSHDNKYHLDLLALYEEYRELIVGDNIDVVCIDPESGEINEYCMESE